MPRQIDHAAVIEDLTFLADNRVPLDDAARRTGFTGGEALDRWLRRHGHDELLHRFIAYRAQVA